MAASWVPSFTANRLDDVKALVSKLIGCVYCGDHLWKSNEEVNRATPHVVGYEALRPHHDLQYPSTSEHAYMAEIVSLLP